jgi:hypothetical protein
MNPHCESTLLWSIQPFPLLSLTPSLPTPSIQQLSVHILMSSTCTDVMFYDITDALSLSFPFPPPLSSIEQFHYYKHVLHMSLYVIMFVLCICLPLDLSSTCKRKQVAFVFWAWLTSFNMVSSNCTHLLSNHRTSFSPGAEFHLV